MPLGRIRRAALCLGLLMLGTPTAHAILAGGEFDLPADSPSNRLDPLGINSPFNFVGALSIFTGSQTYYGSAVGLSPNWVLTAGHNVDFNDDGQVDNGLTVSLHLPGVSVQSPTSITMHPSFTGFGNPSIHHDLSLFYFEDPISDVLFEPVLGLSLQVDDVVTLVGYGRSGYGSYGYTTSASLTDRRIGYNTIRSLHPETGGDGLLFRYDFDEPNSALSLGNNLESIIGPGDSGGPILMPWYDGHALVGISTFTEGYGGRFGDIGGGVSLEPYWGWIGETTGLTIIPEPTTGMLFAMGMLLALIVRRSHFLRHAFSHGVIVAFLLCITGCGATDPGRVKVRHYPLGGDPEKSAEMQRRALEQEERSGYGRSGPTRTWISFGVTPRQ